MEEDVFSNDYGDVVLNPPILNGRYNSEFKIGRPRLDSRMSICSPSKGLVNGPGENNCFLNASIQLLWHVNVFRRSFRLLEGHACLGSACIFCALKKIFHQLEDSNASVLAADDLRQAMANAFMDERRFQLGRMDDAAECFENILTRLHCHIAWPDNEDTCSALHCIPHQKLASNVLEQTTCNCQATSEPKSFYKLVYYVNASALIEQARLDRNCKARLGELLGRTVQQGDNGPCPDEKRCLYKGGEAMTNVQTTLLNRPDVFTIGIIWDTACPSAQYINDVMNCIKETLYIEDLFDNVLDDEYKHLEMKLTGVVTYYGRHYTSFFYNINEKQWTYFDDAQVSKIGSSWKNVKDKCERTRFQPLLIVFTNGSGLPVSTENARKKTEFVSKEILLAVKPPAAKQSARRKHDSHHNHRKKNRKSNRHGSRSPSGKAIGNDIGERTSSRSSNGSQSPKSPKRNLLTAISDSQRIGTVPVGQYTCEDSKTFDNGKHHRNSNEELSSLVNSAGSYSKPPKNLIRGSASDGSIVDRQNGENENECSRRKRNNSMKKKVGSVFKSMNPKYRSFKSSNKNSNSVAVGPDKYEFLKPDVGNFADVGYDEKLKPNTGESPAHSRDHSPSEQSKDFTKNQLKNLELHKEQLKSKTHQQKKDNTGHTYHNGHISGNDKTYNYENGHDQNHHCDRADTGRHHGQHYREYSQDNQQQHTPDVIPDENNEELFQELLSRGDKYLSNSDYYERKGDVLYALQLCTYATATFREACKLSGISNDLLQFVDSKRHESFQRSQQIQHSLDSFFDGKDNTESVQPEYPGYHGQNGSTSGYSSMSDATLKSEIVGNDYMYQENVENIKDDVNELIHVQNTNARQQALARIRNDQQPRQQQQRHPQQQYKHQKQQQQLSQPTRPSHQHTSADTLRRKSMELILDRRDSLSTVSSEGSRFPPPRSLNLPRTSTLPADYQRPTKPSNGYNRGSPKQQRSRGSFTPNSEDIYLSGSDVTEKQPKIPTPTIGYIRGSPTEVRSTGSFTTSYEKTEIERQHAPMASSYGRDSPIQQRATGSLTGNYEKNESMIVDISNGNSPNSYQLSSDDFSTNTQLNSFPKATTPTENNTACPVASSYLRHSYERDDLSSKRKAEHVRSIYDNVDGDEDRSLKVTGRFSQIMSAESNTNPSINISSSPSHCTPPLPSHPHTSGSQNSSLSFRFTPSPHSNSSKTSSIAPSSGSQENNTSSKINTLPETRLDNIVKPKDINTSSTGNVTMTTTITTKDIIRKLNNNDVNESSDSSEYETIYDDCKQANNKRSSGHVTTNSTNENASLNECSKTSTTPLLKPKELIKKFNKPSLDSSSHTDEFNTLQRLKKEGKTSFRCPQCKFRHVKQQGEYCENCRTEYMSTLKKKVVNSSTLSQTNENTEEVRTSSCNVSQRITNLTVDTSQRVAVEPNMNTKENHSSKTLQRVTVTSEANLNAKENYSSKTLQRVTVTSEANMNTKANTNSSNLQRVIIPTRTSINTAITNNINNNNNNSIRGQQHDTLEKVKKQVKKKLKCVQCGWKQVEAEGQCCIDCQSEYL